MDYKLVHKLNNELNKRGLDTKYIITLDRKTNHIDFKLRNSELNLVSLHNKKLFVYYKNPNDINEIVDILCEVLKNE